jgi:glycine/D-amino acid oxidase-like deaminating enzyme
MDLVSGQPFWLMKNGVLKDEPALLQDINCEVLIIGSGITGCFVAHELCNAGYQCTVIDKRTLSTGSSIASTGLLQYEIDVPLYELIQKTGEKNAIESYLVCLQAIKDIEQVLVQTNTDAGFESRSCLYLASDRKGLKEIKKEYECRIKNNLPVEYVDANELNKKYGLTNKAALYNTSSAVIDVYRACIGILDYHQQNHDLHLYTKTEIASVENNENGFICLTTHGYRVHTKYIVCACGYEAGTFLPETVMKLISTYAMITKPLEEKYLWDEESLIWETARPYFYLRTTSDKRIIAGGGDVPFKNSILRDRLLNKKSNDLLKKLNEYFPLIPAQIEFDWCGTFSETKDGLPYIGEYPGNKNFFFALGYGGNGITFGIIAAQMIRSQISGLYDPRTRLFSFSR